MKKTIILLSLLLSVCASAQLKINELMSNNISAIMDDSYNYSMWVELYNASANTSYNQSNYYFTDDLSQPKKWKPKSRTIAAGNFNVIWFERDEIDGHANFKLQPEGGTLYLLNTSGEIIDIVGYPAQIRNVSYGRKEDGKDEWVYFYEYSNGQSNNNRKRASQQCSKPIFGIQPGFYSNNLQITINLPQQNETIYYTKDGSEPTINSTKYETGSKIQISSTTCLRAKTFSDNKLPSDIATATYFINSRKFNLPVASIVTTPANLFDNTIGIYTTGTNGISGNGSDSPQNWNQDWDRPANFELFDSDGIPQLNQEIDISISGGWTRGNPQKSLKLSPRKKHGDNRLRYDFFPVTKSNQKYKDIQIRNSGNDFYSSMMRDGFMQSLIINRMNIDYVAYQPAICFMNGSYYGIQNLRERSNKDYLYSNYGLDEEDFILLDIWEASYNQDFVTFANYIKNNDITQSNIYNQVKEMLDIESCIHYMISEIYYGNTDWPHNNSKIWKEKDKGKWRYILYDTDFGFNLYDENLHNHNSLNYVLQDAEDWSVNHFRRLMLNQEFKNKFIRNFCIHLSSTFETNRVNQIMDSISGLISSEIVYHKNKWGQSQNFNYEINKMKNFSSNRPYNMFKFIGSQFFNNAKTNQIIISANTTKASYKFFTENIIDDNIALKYYYNEPVSIEANDIPGFKFKHWLLSNPSQNIISMGSNWTYWDKNGIPAQNWFSPDYNDNTWNNGNAQFGYGNKGEITTISYGADANNKYPTAYFRKSITINQLDKKNDFIITLFVDDGAAVYINGTEIGRYNITQGNLSFNTYADTYNNGDYVDFIVNKNLLVEGNNLIAVEVHQCIATSSDLIFDLSLKCTESSSETIVEEQTYTTILNGDIVLTAIYEDLGITDPYADSKIFINEIVASNDQIKDEHGDKDDYIELYNAEDEDINIAGWYLSDKSSDLTLFKIPENDIEKTTISAKGRIIIWADGQPEQGTLHANFSLSKDGETITLSRKNPFEELILVDKVTFPALDKNMSYSRLPDGNTNWVIQAPTFDKPNNNTSNIENSDIYPKKTLQLVNDKLIINNSVGDRLQIFNLAGIFLVQTICQNDVEIIDVAWMNKGVYIVKVKTVDGTVSVKKTAVL